MAQHRNRIADSAASVKSNCARARPPPTFGNKTPSTGRYHGLLHSGGRYAVFQNSSPGTFFVFVWNDYLVGTVLATMTTGEVGFVDPAVGVSVVHNRKAQDGDAEYAALLDQMVVSNSPYELAGIFAAQAVITPGETRGWLIRMLDVYRLRPTNGVGQHRLATWPTSL